MKRPARTIRRFIVSRHGVAGIEFGMILPVLILMLLAFYDAINALAVFTKTRFATNTLAQLSNQYTTIHDSDLTQILGATATVLAPYTGTSTSSVTQIAISSSGNATVSWSNTLTPGTAITIPAALKIPNSYLIYSKVSYVFTPTFGYFLSGPITLIDSLYVSPRNSASIARVSP